MPISHRIFIAYLHLLVTCKVFDVIKLRFSVEGHTHDGEPMIYIKICT